MAESACKDLPSIGQVSKLIWPGQYTVEQGSWGKNVSCLQIFLREFIFAYTKKPGKYFFSRPSRVGLVQQLSRPS